MCLGDIGKESVGVRFLLGWPIRAVASVENVPNSGIVSGAHEMQA